MMRVRSPLLTAALPPPPPSAAPLPITMGRRRAKAPLARQAEGMERRAAHGPGARNRMLPCFRRQGACVIFGPVAWRRPGRFTRAPGGTVSSAGGRAPGCLCARLRLSRFDSRSQSLGPRRARRPETPRTPGFRPGQSRSTGPRRCVGAWILSPSPATETGPVCTRREAGREERCGKREGR